MNITTILTRIGKILRRIRYGEQLQPTRDWLMIMSLALIILVGGAGWSYWVFETVSSEGSSTTATSTVPTVSTASLDTVKGVFERRAAERTRYLTEYRFVDPSR